MTTTVAVREDLDRFGYFDLIKMHDLHAEAEIGAQAYSRRPLLSEFAVRAHKASLGAEKTAALVPANDVPPTLAQQLGKRLPSVADYITITSFALGLWWCVGGPMWAGIASILGDEIDGRYARATGTTSERGALLDWGADITLTPMALMRLTINAGMGPVGIIAAPLVLYTQVQLKTEGYRPPIGSARAVIMLAGMAV